MFLKEERICCVPIVRNRVTKVRICTDEKQTFLGLALKELKNESLILQ